jgi:twitching motility protein PilT
MKEHVATLEQPLTDDAHPERAGRLQKFWDATIRLQASDMLVRPGNKVKFRLRGQLRDADAPPFTEEEFEREVRAMLSDEQWAHYHKAGSIDLAYKHDENTRFRVNIFRTMGRSAIAARRISSDIKNFEQLYLPPILGEVCNRIQGLILLCGVTGSGKSTTIAAMLDKINAERPCHILTIEDPIEFMFKDKKAIINQREIGVDVPNFHEALRALVRENPDVVLIGELRDRETFEAAVHAAETGHLVFGTVHASSCAQCFSRIYNLFPEEERGLIREMFGQTLQCIVYQRLMKTLMPDVPRVPAVEVLLGSPVVRKYILDGREAELGDVITKCEGEGMISLNSSLVDSVNKEYIHPKMRLKGIRTGVGRA